MTVRQIRESGTLAPLATSENKSGRRWRAKIIEAGQGSSAFYPSNVLKDYASVFKPGTHMYIDHPGVAESFDRPERSVRDLAGRLVSEGEYEADTDAIWADVEFYSWAAPIMEELAGDIGLSIRAYGEAEEGDTGPVLTAFTEVLSVDAVTRAGAGGALIEMLESARPKLVVAEATSNEKRSKLDELVRAAYGKEDTYVWIRDFDDATVWFEVSDPDSYDVYQQEYETANDVPSALTGERVEVRAQTVYVPVTAQESTTRNVETTPKENQMNDEQEALLRQVAESLATLTTSLAPIVESLSPKPEETPEVDPLETAGALAESGLTAAGQKTVLLAVKAGTPLAEAIEMQKNYETEIAEAARKPGGVHVVDESADTAPKVTGFRKVGA